MTEGAFEGTHQSRTAMCYSKGIKDMVYGPYMVRRVISSGLNILLYSSVWSTAEDVHQQQRILTPIVVNATATHPIVRVGSGFGPGVKEVSPLCIMEGV